MALRAADKKDEHGWQILDEEGEVVGHGPSRDKARQMARGKVAFVPLHNGSLPPGTQTIAEVDPILKEPPIERRTPEQIAADEAHATDQRIKQNMAIQKGLWLQLAADLYLFKEARMWEVLGYASFSAYVADADADMEPRWAYQLVEMYSQLVIERGVDVERLKSLHVSKVRAVLPAIRQEKVSVDQAFADCEALGKRDLETKYKGANSPTPGKPDTSSTIYTDYEPQYMQCPTCGSRVEVDEEGKPKGAP